MSERVCEKSAPGGVHSGMLATSSGTHARASDPRGAQMIRRRSRLIAVAAAAVTVAGMTAASAMAHPHGKGHGKRAALAQCEISDAERDAALTDKQKDRLRKIETRMDERSDKAGLTARQQLRLDRIEARMVIRSVMRDAKAGPVLALFEGIDDRKALRAAAEQAGGMRDLIEATEGVTVESLREARRQGRQDARQVVREVCAADDAAPESGGSGDSS